MTDSRICIALDFQNKAEVKEFLEKFNDEKLYVKVGMELFYGEGIEIIKMIKEMGHNIFLDLKLHDIPNTVKSAMKQLAKLEVDMVNVHASGSIAMMKAAIEGLEAGKTGDKRPLCIAVTCLTSLDQEVLDNELLINDTLENVVLKWATNAKEAGLDGVVCSPLESKVIHDNLGMEFKKYRNLIYKFKIEDRSDFNELLKLVEISRIKYADINISVYAFDYFKMQGTSLYIIKDYYKFCEELGLPMNHSNRYPDNIGEAHDRLMIQIETKKSAKDDLMIRERVSNELSKYRFADDDFVITPANSIADLINESAKLNHCVRTYDKRYASGETSIFLIRKRDDVNSPFYTLELSSKNEIKQLRGKNNCTAVNEVLDFVEEWRRKFNLKSSILKQNEDA